VVGVVAEEGYVRKGEERESTLIFCGYIIFGVIV